MCVCVYFRIDTPGSHVGMYVFPYIRTEFMFVFIYLRVGGMWLRIYTQRLHVFVLIYMYRYTESHVLCIFACMYTGFTLMCVHGMIVSACTHVWGTA